MQSEAVRNAEQNVRRLMRDHCVSYRTGFLAEQPLRALPRELNGNWGRRDDDFTVLDAAAHFLPAFIGAKKVAAAVEQLRVPNWPCNDLSRAALHRLMLIYAMLSHAYFRELFPYKNVLELMQDQSAKVLPAQLAIPLWDLSKRTGIAPSMSYGLYALWNYYPRDSDRPLSLDNIEMIHSFTGTLDEKWFVWIHQIIEMTFAPAVPALLKAYFLAKPGEPHAQDVVAEVTRCLAKAAAATRKMVDVLERMREHCDYKTYFDSVRLFYSLPRNIVFDGVEELAGKPMNIFGETGGQTPLQHFRLAVLGIHHTSDSYFNKMREHMSREFRELVELVSDSRIRDFVEAHRRTRALVRRYNMLVRDVLDWRAEHLSLVDDYIKIYGEVHGTGTPPLEWLNKLREETKAYLID